MAFLILSLFLWQKSQDVVSTPPMLNTSPAQVAASSTPSNSAPSSSSDPNSPAEVCFLRFFMRMQMLSSKLLAKSMSHAAGYTLRRNTVSGEAHLRGLVPWKHRSKEMSSCGDTVSNLTGLEIEKPPAPIAISLLNAQICRFCSCKFV